MLQVLDEVVDGMSISFAGVSTVVDRSKQHRGGRRARCFAATACSCIARLALAPAARFHQQKNCAAAAAARLFPISQHNVKLQLTYLDVDKGETSAANSKTEALVKKALSPVKNYAAAA
jgi:hypothetical protein